MSRATAVSSAFDRQLSELCWDKLQQLRDAAARC